MPPTASGQGEPCAAEPRNAHQRLEKLIPPSRLAPEASKFQTPPNAKRFCKRLSYVFFIEIITKGRVDKGGRCPDGTITVARQGDTLVLTWFGSIQGKPIVAYGTLSKK